MNEEQAANLAVTASKELHQLNQSNQDILEILDMYVRSKVSEFNQSDDSDSDGDIVSSLYDELSPMQQDGAIAVQEISEFESDVLQFEYMQTVTGIAIAIVLLLSLGVQLFQIFNKHWR